MVYVDIRLEGEVTEVQYETIKEKLPQIVQQLGITGLLNVTHKVE